MPDIPKIIREQRHLPRAFDPKKYLPLASFEIYDWAHVVSRRFRLRRQLLETLSVTDQRKREGQLEAIKKDIEAILKSPMSAQSKKQIGNFPITKGFSVGPEQADRNTPCVRLLSMFELLSMSHNKRRFGTAIEAFESYAEGNGVTPAQRKVLNKPVFYAGRDPLCDSKPSIASVTVDLSASDELIFEDFTTWLAQTRVDIARRQGIEEKREIRQVPAKLASLRGANKRGAVAYIDLETWSIAEGVRITSDAYSASLNNVFDFCPRTTVRLSKWLLQSSTTETLQAYCHHRSDRL